MIADTVPEEGSLVRSPQAEMWERYAAKYQPRRPSNAAGASTWLNWTQYPDHGPDESVLGDVRGKRVLELGSGAGANLAHLATLGAVCTGIDIVYSIFGAVWFTDPEILFPLVRRRMSDRGTFAFSHLPAAMQEDGLDHVVRQWHLPVSRWIDLLSATGFELATAEIIGAPVPGKPATVLVSASAA